MNEKNSLRCFSDLLFSHFQDFALRLPPLYAKKERETEGAGRESSILPPNFFVVSGCLVIQCQYPGNYIDNPDMRTPPKKRDSHVVIIIII